jgi:hypothetical protein
MKIFAKLSIVSCLLLAAAPASAQSYSDVLLNQMKNRFSASNYTSFYMQNSATRRASPSYSGFSSPTKPFSSYQRSSGMSPYMGLLGANPYQSSVDNYQKIVKPQLDAQHQQERQTQAQAAANQKLGSVASQAPYGLQGATDRAPTGHASVYFNYGGYYTPVQPHGVRGRR